MTITSDNNYLFIRIFINGILHVAIKRDDLVGIQSWREREGEFWIEYGFSRGQSVKCFYDTEEKWKKVLEHLQNSV